MVIGGLIKRVARLIADPKIAVDPKRRVILALDESTRLARSTICRARWRSAVEKGLRVIIGVQSVWQVVTKYGRDLANVLFAQFQIKMRRPTRSGRRLQARLGMDGKPQGACYANFRRSGGREGRSRPIVRPASPPISGPATKGRIAFVRALVHCYGRVHEMEWPLTLWNKKRKGYIPADWIKDSDAIGSRKVRRCSEMSRDGSTAGSPMPAAPLSFKPPVAISRK